MTSAVFADLSEGDLRRAEYGDMTIDPTATTQQAAATTPHHHHHGHGRVKQAMDAAAEKLGMDPSELQQDLSNGQSLDDIAQDKGVSQDDLFSTMTNALTQAGASQDAASQIAQRLADRQWGQRNDSAAPARPPLGTYVDVDA